MQTGSKQAKGWEIFRGWLCRLGSAVGLPIRPAPAIPERPTQLFRQQHFELLALASQLESCLTVFERTGHAADVRECLSRVMGRLETHLIAEDCFMYPALIEHPEPDLSQLAKMFAGEMGDMAQLFTDFGQRWGSVAAIEANPSGFASEVRGFLGALRERIEREDRELYALADQRADLRFY